MQCSRMGFVGAVQTLVKSGADPNVSDDVSNTVYFVCTYFSP